MRASWTAGLTALLACAPALGQGGKIDVAEILKVYRPLNPGVDYDAPADPKEVAACTWEFVKQGDKNVGVLVRDGQGKIIRRFLDANGKDGTDQWGYYKDGFEVYRDVDRNDDRKIDESRWLNAGGTRIASIQGGKVAAWTRLSAEEASKVLVQALQSRDPALASTVIATADELAALGMPAGLVEQARKGAASRKEQLDALVAKLTGWDDKTTWLRFDGVMPHIIPADSTNGLKADVELYENATIFPGAAEGRPDPARLAYLQAPEMVRIGEVWKFVELPRAFNPDKPEVLAAFEGVRSWVFRGGSTSGPAGTPELDRALAKLAEFDARSGEIMAGADPKAIAKFHFDRIQILKEVIAVAPAADQSLYSKEFINSLAAAYQTGQYEEGLKALDNLIERKGPLASYAAFRKLLAEYSIRAEKESDPLKAQKGWMEDLEKFLADYPNSEETPDALFQLASVNEFNGEEEVAQKYYERLAREFKQTAAGRKATGALARLGLSGQSIQLKGQAVGGQTVDLASMRGKTVLVVFWSSTAGPFRRELPEIQRVYKKSRDKNFEVVGVCLDADQSTLDTFLQENPMPWPTVFEAGGMDSRLADEFGIISLPTMFLVDPQGKVVSRSVRTATEVETYLEKPIAARPATTGTR